jgi:hypothetical protein
VIIDVNVDVDVTVVMFCDQICKYSAQIDVNICMVMAMNCGTVTGP